MNIFNIDPDMMDDLATDYLNGMYESQYDEEEEPQASAKGWEEFKLDKVKVVKENELLLDDIPF